MNWRASNRSDEIVISGESYTQVCNHVRDHRLAGEWTIEYFDSNHMWIEMDNIDVAVETGELHIVRASHLEHF